MSICILDLIKKDMSVFARFSKVYLFGSTILHGKTPNDLDLLLIYEVYSDDLMTECQKIRTELGNLVGITIDITALSREEVVETSFLKRLNDKFIQVK